MTKPNCRKCGACCVSPFYSGGFVWVSKADVARLTPKEREKVRGQYLETVDNENGHVCVFFRGKVGKEASCAIHRRRPHLCRIFECGGEWCRQVRKERKESRCGSTSTP